MARADSAAVGAAGFARAAGAATAEEEVQEEVAVAMLVVRALLVVNTCHRWPGTWSESSHCIDGLNSRQTF